MLMSPENTPPYCRLKIYGWEDGIFSPSGKVPRQIFLCLKSGKHKSRRVHLRIFKNLQGDKSYKMAANVPLPPGWEARFDGFYGR